MSRSIARTLLVSVVALGNAAAAAAQQPLPTDPSGISRHEVIAAYDRSSMPNQFELFPKRTVLGYSPDPDRRYGAIHLVCRSDREASTGRCPTSDTGAAGGGHTDIALEFVERRSGLRTEVGVTGSLQRAYVDQRCFRDFWNDVDRPVTTSFSPGCIDQFAAGTGVALRVTDSEIARLVAGHWTAELILDLRADPAGPTLATYIFAFDLTVTDHDAVSIYFPAFDQTAPHVGLNLQYDAIAQTIGGRAVLDMCLYDGLGSQSQYLGVTVRDTGARPPGATGYSVWHQDGGSDATQRVDYSVTLDHAGTRLPMANGVEQQLRGIDTVPLRLVILPGMTQPVYCVPTPLTLDTPRVPVTSKRPGYYSGDLQVELRLPTSRP